MTRIVLLVLLMGAMLLLASEIQPRGIDPDELEHLHAAYLVSLGDIPYRDFFEHHAPALYYAARPLFSLLGPELTVLWAGRACMGLCSLGILALTGLLAKRCGGQALGLPAMTVLAWGTVFHLKAIEFRPDVPATLLLVASACVWTRDATRGRVLLAGFLAGFATLFTQKAIVPAAGLWLGQILMASNPPSISANDRTGAQLPRRSATSGVLFNTLSFALAAAVPWGITFALFGVYGAADDLWRGAIYQLWVWPMRGHRADAWKSVVAADLGLYLAGGCEVIAVLWRWFRSPQAEETDGNVRSVAVLVIWSMASLVGVKAAYAQYYFLWQPWLAILAARRLLAWCNAAADAKFVAGLGVPAVVVSAVQLLLWKRAVEAGSAGALKSLATWHDRLDQALPWCLLMLLASALFAASHGYRRKAILFLMVVGQFYGVLRITDAMLWSNVNEVLTIRAVHKHVSPEGRVLDGFTGGGALRRHVLYYWWINDYSRALMQRFGDDRNLVDELERHPPDAVLFDEELRKLPADVVQWIEDRYEKPIDEPIWLPRK